jgi:hypothetical protein
MSVEWWENLLVEQLVVVLVLQWVECLAEKKVRYKVGKLVKKSAP